MPNSQKPTPSIKPQMATNKRYQVKSVNNGTVNNALATPWYYQILITLIKPLYRLALWRRHRRSQSNHTSVTDRATNSASDQLNTAIKKHQSEIDARFGKSYPPCPMIAKDKDLSIVKGNSLNDRANTYCSVLGSNPTIWCHAVSLGETNTIAPMLQLLMQKGAMIWLTNTTQTGFARAEMLFSNAIATRQMVHTFVPIDDKKVIHTFLAHVKPDLAMFVETELWATTLAELARLNIPSVLVNGRLSQQSYENYRRFRAVSSSMMQNISMIIAQDSDSAKRFRRLGALASKIRLAPSLKWSSAQLNSSNISTESTVQTGDSADKMTPLISSYFNDVQCAKRPIWVAGSTHAGEEEIVLETHQRLTQLAGLQNALLIIVPRHPERFDEVAKLIDHTGLEFKRRSQQELIESTTQVYLVDTMGELVDCYNLSDVSFVGGSMVDIGGHNPIEAAACAKPVIMGSYTESCSELVNALAEVKALQVVQSIGSSESTVNQLYTILIDWLLYPEKAYEAGKLGRDLVHQKSDALPLQMAMIEALLLTNNQIL